MIQEMLYYMECEFKRNFLIKSWVERIDGHWSVTMPNEIKFTNYGKLLDINMV